MTLTQRFLKAKHWQLFLLMFGLPFMFQIIMISTLIANIANDDDGFENTISYYSLFPLLMIVVVAIFFRWFWSIAMGLQYKVPSHIGMNTGRFKIFFFIPLVYILLLMTAIAAGMTPFRSGGPEDPGAFATSVIIILPFHIGSVICLIYCMYFVSKTIKTVELQREVSFADFVGEFVLVWIYPIGIWTLQPRINKMVE